jgi:hypothetical protein
MVLGMGSTEGNEENEVRNASAETLPDIQA